LSDVIHFAFSKDEVGRPAESQAKPDDRDPHATVAHLYNSGTTSTDSEQAARIAGPTGWSNQDLADLYRTQRLLSLAGIATEVDQGLTDEGDPWFVFMDASGEVFVHFSHFDGMYMVTSLVQESPVWGSSLSNLVIQFAQQVQPVAGPDEPHQNIVSLSRRNTVVVHPGAALAALVWAIYLMSDQLVVAAPAPIQDALDTDDVAGAAVATRDLQILPDEAREKAALLLSEQLTAKTAIDAPHQIREAGLVSQAAMIGGSQSMKAVGLGLSLVAISFGVPLEEIKEQAGADSSGRTISLEPILSMFGLTASDDDGIEQVVETLEFSARQPLALIEPQSGAFTELSAVEADITPEIEVAVLAQTSTAYVNVGARSDVPVSYGTNQDTKAELETTAAGTVTIPHSGSQAGDHEFLVKVDDALDSFAINTLEMLARSELTQLVSNADTRIVYDFRAPTLPTASTQDAIVDVALEQGKYESFGDSARKFVDFLLHTYDNIKVVSLPAEVIFIHVDAVSATGEAQPLYAKSWSFDDGGTLSTIGLKSDMELFDLIA
jgi:hypothetical protein